MSVPKPPPLLQWWPVLVAIGSVVANVAYVKSHTEEHERRLVKVEAIVSDHERAIADGRERLRVLETIASRNDQTTALIIEKLSKIERNIAVLCQSVQGAQCVQ